MDIVDCLKAFVATARAGSFTVAAEAMGVSNRLTSKYVAALEHELGVRLLQRTTRRVGLTPAGEELLSKVPSLLDELDDVLSGISSGSKGISGLIRVSAPVSFGEFYITGMLSRFAKMYPDIEFDLRLSDTYEDFAKSGIDVGFRVGSSQNLTLKTRKLGTLSTVAVASQDYLDARGAPNQPEELSAHRCIIDTNSSGPKTWRFSQEGNAAEVQVSGNFSVNSAQAACELAVAGHGIAFGPAFAYSSAIKSGQLVRLLNGFSGGEIPFSAVYLEGRRLSQKVRALIDFAHSDFAALELDLG